MAQHLCPISDSHEGTASVLLNSDHADTMPDSVLYGWKCGLRQTPDGHNDVVTVYENDSKDMAYAVNAMEDAGYEVVNIHFDRGVVEFQQ